MIHLNIGSNLNSKYGSRVDNIVLALNLLLETKIEIKKISNFYETPSYPNKKFPKFLNVGLIVNYRKRIEGSDVIFIMSPCHNFSVNSATANVISWIFAPPWAFSYRQIIGSWGTPVPNKIKNKKVVIGLTYGSPSPIITFAVHQIPRRVQKMVFKHLCGAKVEYLRMYEVLPNMPKKIFDKHMASVRNLVKKL